MKKQLIIFTLFCILLAGIVLAVPALENIYGVKNFVDGLQSNGATVATLDANSKVPLANSYTPDLSGYVPYDANSHVADSAVYDKHTNLDANSLTLAHASIDPNGWPSFANDSDAVGSIGRATIWGNSDTAYFSHYDRVNSADYALKQDSSGRTYLNCKNGYSISFNINNSKIFTADCGITIQDQYGIKYNGNYAQQLFMNRPTTDNTAGNALTVSAGGCNASATDKAGGNLILKSGIATGIGTSQIDFYTATAGSAGTTDNTPTLKLSLNSNGDLIPGIDNNSYIGKNDDDTPFAYKGLILKDTANSKYYRIEITNGVVVPTDLTD